MAQQRDQGENGAFAFSTDDWDGYPANSCPACSSASHDSRVSIPSWSAAMSIPFSPTICGFDFDDPIFAGRCDRFVGTSIPSSYGPPHEISRRALPKIRM